MAKTSKEIRSEIKAFTTDRDALKSKAHSILMDILYHAAPKAVHQDAGGSGDATLALAMLKELPKSWAEQARQWLEEFSPIRAFPSRDVCGLADKYKALTTKEEKYTHWKLEEAAETPFYDFAREPDVVLIGTDKVIGWNVAQAKAWQKKIDENKLKEEAIEPTRRLIEALLSFNLSAPKKANDDQPVGEAAVA